MSTLLELDNVTVQFGGLKAVSDLSFKIAEGELIEEVICTRWTMRVVGRQAPDSCKVKYGTFERLKSNDDEFVCVSFRNWACYPSPVQH